MNIKEVLANKDTRIYACEKSLMLFSLYYFSQYHKYTMPEFHKEWYKDLNDDKLRGLLLIAYRESAKSSLAKIKLVHNIVYSKTHFNIWTSFDKKKAEANLFDVALQLQTNEKIIEDFGQLFYEDSFDKQSKKKSIGEFITTNKIKVKAYSTGQSPRGEVYGEHRPDFIYLDDFENLTTIESIPKTDQVKDYIDELLSGMSGNAFILALANRLSFNGSVSYLEDKIKDDPKFKVYDIPVVKDGEIVWKSRYTHTDKEADEFNKYIKDKQKHKVSLESKRRLLGHQAYNREMLNTPITDEEREFNKGWFQYRTEQEVMNKKTRNFLTIDTAGKEKPDEKDDYIGIVENYIDTDNFWNIKAYRMRLNSRDLISYIFTAYEKGHYEKIGIEKTAFTEGLKIAIQDECRNRNIYLPIEELKHGGTAKNTRIRQLIPRYSNRQIYHIEGQCKDLEDELHNFPRSIYDDVSDSLAFQLFLTEKVLGDDPQDKIMEQNEREYENFGYR